MQKYKKGLMLAVMVSSLGQGLVWAQTTTTVEAETTDDRAGVRVGVQAGMTFGDIRTPRDVTPSNRNGLAAGLLVDIPVASFFSVQPELIFTQRGATLARANAARFNARYNSLELPVFAKLTVGHSFSPFLMAGPMAVLNFSKNVTAETPNTAASVGFSPSTLELGAAVGGGLDLGILTASLRYTVGLTALDENSADWQSRGFHLLAGLRF